MQDAVLNLARITMPDFNDTGKGRGRFGNDGAGIPGNRTYPCKPGGPDDWVYMSATPTRPGLWQPLIRSIGGEELLSDPNYSDPAWCQEHAAELHEMIGAWTMQHTKYEVFHILGKAGVPCGPTLDAADIYSDPHLLEREMIVTLEHPKRGAFKVPGCPIKLTDSPAEVKVAPLLGQHTDEVLAEILGFDEAELAELREQKLIS